MNIRFKERGQIFDFAVTAVAAVLSVGVMLYGVWHFGLREAWPELVLCLRGYHCAAAGCHFLASTGHLPHPEDLPGPFCGASVIAYLFLWPKGLEELHQA